MFELFFFITFGLSDERAYSIRAGPFKENNLGEKRYFLVDRTPIPTLGVYLKISNKYIKSNVKVKFFQSLTKGEGRYS